MDNQIKKLYKEIKEKKISPDKAIQLLKQIKNKSITQNNKNLIIVSEDKVIHKIQAILVNKVSQILKVKKEDIDIDSELSEYGFDSITYTTLANELNHGYGFELTPTIFFEHPNLRSFTEYMLKEHREAFQEAEREEERKQPGSIEEEEKIDKQSIRPRFVKTVKFSKIEREPLAIIGISGVFPGAKDVKEFWENLLEGKDSITEIPGDRWDWKKYYGNPGESGNKTSIKWGGFIEGVYEFDPLFFGISPREAELMDPQQRLLMTYVWKAIEDAGYSAESISGSKTGIFVGTANSGYGERNTYQIKGLKAFRLQD